MTIKLDEDNITVSPTQIDDTDSPYLTNGEQYIYVDTTNGPVTIQLASSDTVDGAEIRVIDTGENASNNNITIQTEGTENINPGSNSSITLTVDGTYVDLFSDGSNWFSDRAVEKTSGQISGLQSLSTGQAVIKRVDSAPAIQTDQTDIVSEEASVSTTDQVILSDGDEAVVWVVGDEDGGTKRFIDRLATTFGNQSNTELLAVNNPATRSYSMPDKSLQLSVGSGVYNVTATAIRMGVQ